MPVIQKKLADVVCLSPARKLVVGDMGLLVWEVFSESAEAATFGWQPLSLAQSGAIRMVCPEHHWHLQDGMQALHG